MEGVDGAAVMTRFHWKYSHPASVQTLKERDSLLP